MLFKICLVLSLTVLVIECDARRNRRPVGRRNRNRNRNQDQDQQSRLNSNLSRKGRNLAQAANDFGISLYKELAPDNENLVLAPIGVLTTMSMVMLGARGETENNLFQGLKLQPLRRARKVHRAFKSYSRSVADIHGNVTFDTINAMYVRPNTSLQRKFRKKIKKCYNGENKTFDFSHPEGPEVPINDWIETKTRGLIQNFLADGDVEEDTVMWLINIVYFKGTWDWIFEEHMTRQGRFQVSASQEVQVMMMNNDYSYAVKYDSNLAVKVLELPYDGNRFSFFIILPDVVGLAELESRLNRLTLEGLITNMGSPSRYLISIPKFKLTSTMNLIDHLRALGVINVFQRGAADLSGINGQRNLYVDAVRQKAVIEVNERGTVAAAVTGLRVTVMSLPPQFTVDRPFIYVLRDKSTATNLFIGRVNNPTNS